jgi:predicted phage terminase large subunit-like protein
MRNFAQTNSNDDFAAWCKKKVAVDYKYFEWCASTNKKRPSQELRMEFIRQQLANPDKSLAAVAACNWVDLLARDEQVPYYFSDNWRIWLYMAGRGTGKTRAGSEWILHKRRYLNNKYPHEVIHFGVIVPVASDIHQVVVNGPAGIMTCMPTWEREECTYIHTREEIVFRNGTSIHFYSAENAERLRGKQFHYLWLDELASWKDVSSILLQVDFTHRLIPPEGHAQRVITTTPKPQAWARKLEAQSMRDKQIIITRGNTIQNRENLSQDMYTNLMQSDMDHKTRLQEIFGELLGEDELGIVKRNWFKILKTKDKYPKLMHVFNSYDTAYTIKKRNDPSACVKFGIFKDKEDGEWCALILGAWCKRLEYPELKDKIVEDWNMAYGTGDTFKRPDCFIVENKASGQAITSDLKRMGMQVWGYTPGKGDDKHAKMHRVAPIVEAGRIYLPESRRYPGEPVEWAAPLLEQLVNFPAVDHDDYCDAFSNALIVFSETNILELSYDIVTDPFDDDEEIEEKEPFVNPYAI